MMKKKYVNVEIIKRSPAGNSSETLQISIGSQLKDFAPKPDSESPAVVAAFVNNMLKDLNYHIYCDSQIEWLDYASHVGNKIYKYSLSLLLYVACQELYPEHELKVLHSLRNGRYCELRGESVLGAADFAAIESKMREMVQADLSIKKDYLTRADAIRYYPRPISVMRCSLPAATA